MKINILSDVRQSLHLELSMSSLNVAANQDAKDSAPVTKTTIHIHFFADADLVIVETPSRFQFKMMWMGNNMSLSISVHLALAIKSNAQIAIIHRLISDTQIVPNMNYC